MIDLFRINGDRFFLNCNEIERIEIIPETAIILLNGKTHIVKNTAEEVVDKIIEFNRRIHQNNKSV